MPRMTYVLIHGAADVAWYWHLVSSELRGRGHDVVAVDLPCEDESAGWSQYADTVCDAIGDRSGLVVVAQSLGGFTAPIVCARKRAELLDGRIVTTLRRAGGRSDVRRPVGAAVRVLGPVVDSLAQSMLAR